MLRTPTRTYDGYIFDLDGTVYLGSELLPGAQRLLTGLREQGSRIVFLSNNPTRDPQMYVDKLTGLGIEVSLEEILNTVSTMTTWLTDHAAGKKVFVIGEQPLKSAIAAAGLELSEDPAEIDVVVASYDRGFDYRKLQIAYDALAFHKRAVLVTTNPDVFCPFPGGRGEPDAGAIVAAIEACTGVRCSVNAGKPDSLMVRTAMNRIGLAPEQCVMVGDRLSTDIAMGIAAGMDSALVLTGETTLPMLAASSVRPTWVLDRIDELLAASG
ncbi:HAD-IIA family hydrolase [Nakamurella flavida]|uniref:HAD-IIA family hydrolase n=1 Tax=Nakamurella flavida TaxID=363630 RepID=A0A938YCE8_9ACTN|nr:HAD-IIA family hydrolase [Nakamurella flavida]MBM9475086.1 HAD-IIA family hydrolase [Nakamurella flavida]MDP9776655.1 phosphoglycolate/pyridoxal phosphate phosphatase family enzyme [Nakamurella flavida]